MLMGEIRNIKALTKIQLRQIRNLYIALIGASIVLLLLYTTLYLEGAKSVTSPISQDVVMGFPFYFVVFAAILFLRMPNLYRNQTIGMYPGTGVTRLLSRVVCDHIWMLSMVIFSILEYLALMLFLMLYHSVTASLYMGYLFDWKYLLIGPLVIFSYYLMCYSLVVLVITIISRLGRKKSVILFAVLFVSFFVAGISERIPNDLMSQFIMFFTKEERLGIFLLKTWIIWGAGMLLSIYLSQKITILKKEIKGILVISVLLCYMTLMSIVFSYQSYSVSVNESTTLGEEFQNLKNTYLFTETVLKSGKFQPHSLTSNSTRLVAILSFSQAVEEGILTAETKMEEGKIKVYTFFPKEGYRANGKNIYQYSLDHMTLTRQENGLQYDFSNQQVIFAFLWGDAYRFLPGYQLDHVGQYSNFEDVLTYVIAPDELLLED